jgi:NADH-quinone oxidoreductase subunit M
MRQMSGLWFQIPYLAAIGLFFAIASLGLPGLGNFVGEFLILLGTYRVNIPFAIAAAIGLVMSVLYALILVQRAFHGKAQERLRLHDFSTRGITAMAVMIVLLLWLGLYPQPIFNLTHPALENLQQLTLGSR